MDRPLRASGKAVGYPNAQWKRWVRYVQDGRSEIDNNLIENAVRPVALEKRTTCFWVQRMGVAGVGSCTPYGSRPGCRGWSRSPI